VELRPLKAGDVGALIEFFADLPAESTDFLRDDVRDPAVVTRFVANHDPDLTWAVVALHAGKIVGDATLHMQPRGWRRHLGEIRVVVSPEYRRNKLAMALIHELVDQASLRELAKLEAQILDSQVGALRAFSHLGFTEEARLKDHAKDASGNLHDILIMTHNVSDLWAKMEDLNEDFVRDAY